MCGKYDENMPFMMEAQSLAHILGRSYSLSNKLNYKLSDVMWIPFTGLYLSKKHDHTQNTDVVDILYSAVA